MEETNKKNKSGYVFRVLYIISLLSIAAVLLRGIIGGLKNGDIIGSIVLTFVFLGTPLSTIFLVLNIWGLIRDKKHRSRYLIIATILLIWNIIYWPAILKSPLP